MKRYIYRIATMLAALAAVLLIAAPVLAAYYTDIIVTESDGNSYDMLPVAADMDIAYLAANEYIETDGRDIRVKTIGGAEVPFMLVDDKVLFASSIDNDRQNTFRLSTGNSLIDNFSIVTGYGGYITTADHANLALSDDFAIEFDGYIDTTVNYNYTRHDKSFYILSDSASGKLIANFYPDLLTYTDDYIQDDDWTVGFSSDSDGQQSKESDHLYLRAWDYAQRTYVTDYAIDLTGVDTLYIDWYNYGAAIEENISAFVASTSKASSYTVYDARLLKTNTFSRTTDSLDVSGLSGQHYIRVHAKSDGESSVRQSKIDVYAVYAGNQGKKQVETVIDAGEYAVKVYADGSDLKLDIDGDTKDTAALNGAVVLDNSLDNDWIISALYFNYYKHTTADTLRLTYQPDDILIGTTLPNELAAGTYDGVITYGSAPSGIAVDISGLETYATSYPTDAGASQDIIQPTTAPLFDVNLERLEHNPLRPVVVLIATEVNLTERLVWLGGGFFLLFAALILVLWKSEGQITFTAFAGLGVCIIMYLLGIFPLWPSIVFGIGVVAAFVWERVIAL